MGSIAEKLARVQAQLAQVDAMIEAASSAMGVEDVGIGSTRTRRVDLAKLFKRQEELEAKESRLKALSLGRIYIRR